MNRIKNGSTRSVIPEVITNTHTHTYRHTAVSNLYCLCQSSTGPTRLTQYSRIYPRRRVVGRFLVTMTDEVILQFSLINNLGSCQVSLKSVIYGVRTTKYISRGGIVSDLLLFLLFFSSFLFFFSFLFVFFFFFHWHYSPLWALACRTMSFHFFLSATNSLHLLTPSTLRSLSYFLFPSSPGSSLSSRPFQFLSEDLFGHPILRHSL